ncbi:MAG: hypothetical protein P4M12_02330 [Gammaproteobacteria bacterium]|nr:hypothetical protein [Gammaproteobacteria bacterium]
MLLTILELKSAFPQSNELPEYYQHLFNAEALFNHPTFTTKEFELALEQIKLAENKLNQALTEKDKSFYYFLNSYALYLTAWIDNDKEDIYSDVLEHALTLNPDLNNAAKRLRHCFDIFEYVAQQDESYAEENNIDSDLEDEYFHQMLPSYIDCTTNIINAFYKIIENDYYFTSEVLSVIGQYLESLDENNVFIEKSKLHMILSKIEEILNEIATENKAIIRDRINHDNINLHFYISLSKAQDQIHENNFLEADDILKQCHEYTNKNDVDNFLKIYVLTCRAYIHKSLSILVPNKYKNREFTSKKLFESAYALCRNSEDKQFVEEKENIFDYILYVSQEIPDNSNTQLYLKHLFSLSHDIYNAEKLYSIDNPDITDKDNQLIILNSRSFYYQQSIKKNYDHLVHFNLSSIDRLLGNEDSFMLYFLNFIVSLQFINKIPEDYKNYSHKSDVINRNIKFFLTLCNKRKIFTPRLEKIVGHLIQNKKLDHATFYDVANEFSKDGHTVAATFFMTVGLLLEGICDSNTIQSENYITEMQTRFLKERLWDESLYLHLYLAPIYLDLLVYSHIQMNNEAIDLDKEFKKVIPNITHQGYKFLTEVKAKQCEDKILSIFNSPDKLSLRNCANFRAILELTFVSKLIYRMAAILEQDINLFKIELIKLNATFPKWKSAANAFFENLMPKSAEPLLANAATSSSPAQENKEETVSPVKKKARAKKSKKIIQSTVFPQHIRHAATQSMSKNMLDNKIPEHIVDLVTEQVDKQSTQQTSPVNDEVMKKERKKKTTSRRQATQQYTSASSIPAPIITQEKNVSSDEEEPIIAPSILQPSAVVEPSVDASSMCIAPKLSPLKHIPMLLIIIPAPIQSFIKLLKSIGSKRTALVGGYVRDQLLKKDLGKENQDYDVVTDLPIAIIKQKLPELFVKTSFSDDYHNINYAGIEIDLKFSSHLSFKELNDLEAYQYDARSRDFTCNILYANEDGFVFDPLDKGIEGLKESYLISVNDMKVSFLGDPIRMFRAIYSTNKRGLEFSDEMKHILPECIELSEEYLANPSNSGKINSLMVKLLCPIKIKYDNHVAIYANDIASINFKQLEEFGFIKRLFPKLDLIFQKNTQFKDWIIKELTNQKDTLNLNYIYAMFILGSMLVKQAHNENIVFNDEVVLKEIISVTPLLKKNFESWNFTGLVLAAINAWLHYKNPNLDSASSSYHHSSSMFFGRNATPKQHSQSAPPSFTSPSPNDMPNM